MFRDIWRAGYGLLDIYALQQFFNTVYDDFIWCLFLKFGAGSINAVFGYRTKLSMINQLTWDFANLYFARLWIKVGCVMLPLSVVLMLPVIGKSTDTIGWWGGALAMVQCVVLIVSIFPVERALNKKFDKDGNPKNTSKK